MGFEPTCTESGLTPGKKCVACGEVLVPQTVVPATGHSFNGGVCEYCKEIDPDYVPEENYSVNTIEVTQTANDDGTVSVQIGIKNADLAGIRLCVFYSGYKFCEAYCPDDAKYFDEGEVCNFVWSSGENVTVDELELLNIQLAVSSEDASEVTLEIVEIYEFADDGELIIPDYEIVYNN